MGSVPKIYVINGIFFLFRELFMFTLDAHAVDYSLSLYLYGAYWVFANEIRFALYVDSFLYNDDDHEMCVSDFVENSC